MIITIKDPKLDVAALIKLVQEAALEGTNLTAQEAAETARQALIAPDNLFGGTPKGLSTQGYGAQNSVATEQYPHNASGALVNSIRTEVQGNESLALTDSPYAYELNYGRMPGVEPSEIELEQWISVKGLKISAKRLARQIARNGMAATGFWTAAESSADTNAMKNIGEAIEKKFRERP